MEVGDEARYRPDGFPRRLELQEERAYGLLKDRVAGIENDSGERNLEVQGDLEVTSSTRDGR